MAINKSLDVPPAVERDKAAFEVLRVWVAERGQHVSIRSGAWEDPAAWGVVLADLARHVAHAHHLKSRVNEEEFLGRVLESFYDEIEDPSEEPEGEVKG
jgi:uncharacterized protein DUF5076